MSPAGWRILGALTNPGQDAGFAGEFVAGGWPSIKACIMGGALSDPTPIFLAEVRPPTVRFFFRKFGKAGLGDFPAYIVFAAKVIFRPMVLSRKPKQDLIREQTITVSVP